MQKEKQEQEQELKAMLKVLIQKLLFAVISFSALRRF